MPSREPAPGLNPPAIDPQDSSSADRIFVGEKVDIDEVGWNIIRNLVFLKFGINMLSPIDYHIK